MLVKESNMPDISHLGKKLVSIFLAGSLVGAHSTKAPIEKKLLPVLARLIDKAMHEYNIAKDYIEAEEAENKMSYEEIIKRNTGQYLYTCQIMDHLENCITTIARIYKIKEKHLGHQRNQGLVDIRDSIEHVDERIRDVIGEPPVLNISEDSISLEIAARDNGVLSIKTQDIADELAKLYTDVRAML